MTLLQSTQKLQQGDTAPDFKLQNAVTDESVSLQDIKGPVLVLFMCNHCPFVIMNF